MPSTYTLTNYANGPAVEAALDRALAAPQFHGFEGRSGSSLNIADTVLFLAVPSAQSVWLDGTEYALTAGLSIDLGETPDVGAHFIVAQDDGAGALELSELPSIWSITATSYTPVAEVYWQGGGGAVLDERHGHDRNLGLHAYLHSTVGARVENDGSFAQTRPTTTNDGQLELVAGSLWDEDIENAITTAQGKLVRNWYETASGVWTWTNGADNAGYDRPYIWNSGTSLLRYPNTGSAYALTDCANNRFIAVWAYASNDVDRPIYIVTPALAATYTTVANARAALAPVLPFAPELKLLYRWIYRGNGEYQEAADYRTASSLPSGGVTTPVASSVSFVPSGTLAATNVQAALEEVDDEKITAPAASTDNAIARFDGTTGKLLQDSSVATLSDNGRLALATGTVTTNQPVLDLSQTWNDGAVSFTGITANITDTASAYASKLIDLQVGGISKAYLTKNGVFCGGIGLQLGLSADGRDGQHNAIAAVTYQSIQVANSAALGWSNDAWGGATLDLALRRDAAGILAQRNGTNAQIFCLYNTYTDASNYERLAIGWSTNVVSIKPENAGTGSARVLHISGLPTSNPGPGILWNNGGTPAIGT